MFAYRGADPADVGVEFRRAGLVDGGIVAAGGEEDFGGVEVAGVQDGVEGDFEEVGEGGNDGEVG